MLQETVQDETILKNHSSISRN